MSDINLGSNADCFVNLPNGKRALAVNNADGPFDIFQQDQVTPPFQYFMMTEEKTDITLTAPVSTNDEIINVSAGHGFTSGSMIVIAEGDAFEQAVVKSVNVNAITINIPVAGNFTTAATVIRGNRELNLDGSVTPVDFFAKLYGVGAVVPVDFIGAKITMIHAAAGDLTKFGSLAELTNGFYLRKMDGNHLNLANYTKNQDFEDFGWNVRFDDRAGGGGEYSTIVSIQLKESYGIAIRLNPSSGDCINGVIRDDLTGLLSFRIQVFGHFTQGEN